MTIDNRMGVRVTSPRKETMERIRFLRLAMRGETWWWRNGRIRSACGSVHGFYKYIPLQWRHIPTV